MSLEKSLDKIREHAEDVINEAAKKPKLEVADFELTGKAIKMLHHIKQMENGDIMMRENGYTNNASYRMMYDPMYQDQDNMSYRRGRSSITGRYVSRDAGNNNSGYSTRRHYDNDNFNGYSGHSKREGMIETLEEMYANAQNEQERQYLQKWLDRVKYNQ